MIRRLFFNHHLKEKRSREPKAAVLQGESLVYGNVIDIVYEGRVVATLRSGKLKTPVHDVIGWVETDCEVRVR